MTIHELLEKKKGLVQAGNEIRDRVYAQQNGEWRGDDTATFDKHMEDAEKISAEVDRLAKLEAAQRSLEGAEQPQGRRSVPERPGSQPGYRPAGKATVEDRALAFHGWVASSVAEGADILTDRHREAAARCGINLDQNKLRIRLAADPLRSLRADDIRNWEQRLTQVTEVSPDLGGHFTVPDEMMRALEVALLRHGGMREVSTVIRTSTGADLPIPKIDDTSNSGAILSEGSEHTELDTEFTQLVLNSFKYTSKRVPVSVEYLQDNAINFVSRIGEILGTRIARITNEHFTRGDGSSKPNGVVTAATTSSITTSGGTTITHDNIVDLKHSVDPDYRTNGRFMFNDTTLKILKKIKVAQFSGDTGGWPLWRAGLTANEPDTIDGDPYTVNQQVESGTGTKAMLYGDFSKYIIRDVRDVTLVRLDERYAELGVVAFLAFSRHDGDLLDAGTHPVKFLTMG